MIFAQYFKNRRKARLIALRHELECEIAMLSAQIEERRKFQSEFHSWAQHTAYLCGQLAIAKLHLSRLPIEV